MRIFSTLKKGGLLLLATLGLGAAQAQTSPNAPDPVRQYLDNLVAPLDKTQVPTGFLVEYGVPLVPLDVFNGTLTDSSRTNPDGFRFIYATAYSAWLGGSSSSNPLLSPLDLNTRISSAVAANPTAIPVMVQHIDYATVRSDAFSNGLLNYQNNQLFDVAGRSQSPYVTNTLFAAAPAAASAATGDVTLIFPNSLDIERGVGTPMTLSVDFGDGRGYLNAAWNQPIAAHYTSAGSKRIKVKITYTAPSRLAPRKGSSTGTGSVYYPPAEGLTYESQFDMQVASPASSSAASRTASTSSTSSTSSSRPGTADDLPVTIAPQSGVHDGALMTIHYATGHTQLINPFIVVEGYDKNHIAPAVQPQNYDIGAFLTDIATQGGFRFLDALERGAMGTGTGDPYDIVFIDFNNGTDDILRNAAVFEQVLNEVQQRKVGTAPNVVMGMSMGGLIARYKLAQLEKASRGSAHTRLLILQDSPQRGANVPLGIQALTRQVNFLILPTYAIGLTDISNFIRQGILLLDEPATQQMLVHRATSATGGFSANTFLAGTYRSMINGDTSPNNTYQIVAASQGSQCSQALLNPGADLVRADGEIGITPMPWLVRGALAAEVQVKALPANGQASQVAHVAIKERIRLFRFINITITVVDRSYTCPSGLLAWDGVPGSTEDILKDGLDTHGWFNTWPLSLLCSGIPVIDAHWNATVAAKFTFLPTASALDVPITSQAVLDGNRYSNGIGYPTQPDLKSFIAQESFPIAYVPGYGVWGSNKPHLAFTPRNTEWMYDVMQQQPFGTSYTDYSCGTADNLAISGTTQLCAGTTGSYTVTNLPAGATVQWSLSSSSVATAGSASAYPFMVQATGSGQVTVQAVVTMPSGNRLTLKGLDVSIGASQVYIGVYGGCGGLPATFTAGGSNLGTDFRWVINRQAMSQFNGQSQVTYTLPSDPGVASIPVTVTVTGTCPGSGTLTYTTDVGITHDPGCANELTHPAPTAAVATRNTALATASLYPNPARETVDIHLENVELNQALTVRLYDSQGQLRIERGSAGEQTMRLKTNKLLPGIYFVHIIRGREVLSRQQLKIEQ